MMINPKLTVIMATFNRASLIKEAIEAIINQSYEDWECLVIDDGSMDNTEQIVESISNSDSRLQYIKRPNIYNKGLPGCRNAGIDRAKGDYIVFFDDDDICHPDLFQMVMDVFAKDFHFIRYLRDVFWREPPKSFNHNKEVDFTTWRSENLVDMVSGKIPFNSCQVIWRKDCFDGFRFDESLMFAEEWELYTRLLSEDLKGGTLEKVLYFARKHEASNTGEFNQGKPLRKKSMVLAARRVIETVSRKGKWNSNFYKFFLRMSFVLKDSEMLSQVLRISNVSTIKRHSFIGVLKVYPILKPFLKIKSKF